MVDLKGRLVSPVKKNIEVELKFLVPADSRALLALEMARGSATLERLSLLASYLDTPDRRLARQGLSWRIRREGGRWIQTLKASGTNTLKRSSMRSSDPIPTAVQPSTPEPPPASE